MCFCEAWFGGRRALVSEARRNMFFSMGPGGHSRHIPGGCCQRSGWRKEFRPAGRGGDPRVRHSGVDKAGQTLRVTGCVSRRHFGQTFILKVGKLRPRHPGVPTGSQKERREGTEEWPVPLSVGLVGFAQGSAKHQGTFSPCSQVHFALP